MWILGVSASPRKGRSTRQMLEAALAAAGEAAGCATQVLDLAERRIAPCLGCDRCKRGLTCSQDDAMRELLPRLADPGLAGVLLASPVYMGGMSAQAKAFLDRSVALRRNGFLWADKPAGALAVGNSRHGGQELTVKGILAAFLIHGMVVVGDAPESCHFGGMAWSGGDGGIAADAYGLATARNLGLHLGGLARRLSAGA